MDAFYASVEQRDDPALRGKPVAVGGRPETRGVVAAASYEARTFGVRSAMPMARAVRLCPQLMIVHPDFERYRQVSRQVMDLLRTCTSLVEPLSLDEAYLDVTENTWNEPLGVTVARRLKDRIKEATEKVRAAGVADRVTLIRGDIFDPSIKIQEASVVTLYLLQTLNEKLAPRLKSELKSGSPVMRST